MIPFSCERQQSMSSVIAFDRSRLDATERCRRLRYFQYEYNGVGLQPATVGLGDLDWITGQAVHTGIETLLKGGTLEEGLLAASLYYSNIHDIIDVSIDAAAGGAPPQPEFQVLDKLAENKALAEALIRSWALVRLPKLLAEWEVLAVEQEVEAHFTEGIHELVLMARPDLLHRRKSDGALFIRNFKTVSQADKNWREQWRYDQQTFSEVLAAEQHLSQNSLKVSAGLLPQRVGGVIIEGLLKGRRLEYPEGSGRRYQNSPLVQCWYRQAEGGLNEEEFYALDEYETTCQGPHKSGRRFCPGGRSHRLSGVTKMPVWEKYPGGVAGWVAHLAAVRPETLEAQFIELPPILRPDYEIERWKRQTLPQEVELWRASNVVQALPEERREAAMDRYFPQSTSHGNCLRPSVCNCFNLCWGQAAADPLNSGYQIRIPNHPVEKEFRRG
jgi:hypothetical protein